MPLALAGGVSVPGGALSGELSGAPMALTI